MGIRWRSFSRKHALALVVLALFAAGWFVRDAWSLADLVSREESLRQAIDDHPTPSFLIGMIVYTLTSLIPGTSGKSIIFGWLFGFVQAVLIVLIGLTAAAMVTFALSRGLLRPFVESRFGHFVRWLNGQIEKGPAVCLLTLQFANVPYTLINYVGGASRVDAWTFCWTTFVGLLPGTFVFVYVGTTLPTLNDLATKGFLSLVAPELLAALVLVALLPVSVRLVIRRMQRARSVPAVFSQASSPSNVRRRT